MCLGVPGRVLRVDGDGYGLVDFGGGVKRRVNLSLLSGVREGDYVIVHVGFAIQKLDEKEAEEMIRAWAEVLKALEATGKQQTGKNIV